MRLEDLIGDQGDVAFIVEYDHRLQNSCKITACTSLPPSLSSTDIALCYLSACDSESCNTIIPLTNSRDGAEPSRSPCTIFSADTPLATFATKKKYKPVARKVRPVLGTLPARFRIERNIIGDPLADIPLLSPHPPPFVPHGRYTAPRHAAMDALHPPDFLWPAERDLLHHFVVLQHEGFAWDDSERGHFREDFFPPVEIPVVAHVPWVERNIRIPPGIYDEICRIIRMKIDAGVYEPSNSSYRSRWFCVSKKDGTSLRPVHSLEPLNAVTIQHSGVTPFTEQIAEQFAGRACGGMLDLYVSYDERALAEASRDYTTFQTPYGAFRLTKLPMGWTNAVPVFHDDVTHILQPEVPQFTIPYIDDVPVRGPATAYQNDDGAFETIAQNSGIRRFVWDHFQNLNRIVQRMKYCGGTFSGKKSVLCAREITVVGHVCTPEGRIPDPSKVDKILHWGPCSDLSEVRAFLGTIGVVRVFIKDFARLAHPLTSLTRKDAPFVFGPEQIAAQDALKAALLASPALQPIDYASSSPVILAVDTSHIAIGYLLCQCDADNPRIRRYARFGSITLNDRESRFSQPKLELYGLFRTLRSLKMYLIGVRNLVIEVDARYIKGMLTNPDLAPSASINRWIVSILLFHFTLVHVPGTRHGPDGLSRRPRQPSDGKIDPADDPEFDDWVDRTYGFMHHLNPLRFTCSSSRTLATLTNGVAEENITRDDPPDNASLSYHSFPRSEKATREDDQLRQIREWFVTLERPANLSDVAYAAFIRYSMHFFIRDDRLWRRDSQECHKIVVSPDNRPRIIAAAHDDTGHHGHFATRAHIIERFWWPHLSADIAWFIKTCHICQLRQTRNLLIPPTVALPAPLFAKMYMDTMHLPKSGGFKYLVQGRCSLTHYPEFRALRTETAKTIGDWIFEDILCRWGTLCEIVTDNGPAFVKALGYLGKRYHIRHIRISGYNSRANGIVERAHFDVRQALFKACDGDQSKWHSVVTSVMWADRVTVRRRMGCSPFFAVTGAQPLLPLDITEATYLLPPPDAPLSTTDLISNRAIALQKRRSHLANLASDVYVARVKAAIRFEQEHAATITDYNFHLGDLVLIRNTAIEKALNRKMRARYIGPLIVISRNKGGAYIVSELDGSVFDRPIAAFRVIPYFARQHIEIPPLDELIDISAQRLRELENTTAVDPEDDSDVLAPDEHPSPDPDDDED